MNDGHFSLYANVVDGNSRSFFSCAVFTVGSVALRSDVKAECEFIVIVNEIFMNKVRAGEPPIFGDGEPQRAFSFVGGIRRRASENRVDQEFYGKVFNVGPERSNRSVNSKSLETGPRSGSRSKLR